MDVKRTLVVLLVLAPALTLWAARPLANDDAGTVEVGKFEIELLYEHNQCRPSGLVQASGFQLKHGLTPRMDIGLGFGHETKKDAEGATVGWGTKPLSVTLKAAVLKGQRAIPDISLLAGLESGSNGWSLKAAVSREIWRLGMRLNAGYEGSGQGMERGTYGFGLAAESAIFERLRLCAEWSSELLDDGRQVLGNSGLVGGSIDLGFGAWDLGGRIYDRRGPRWQAVTGFTFGF